MLQMNPALSPIEIRRLLRQTASQADAPDNQMGWGIVNADAAIRAAEHRARAHPPSVLRVDPVSPNPASDQLTIPIHAPASTHQVTLSLQTPLGRAVATNTFPVRPGPNWLTMDVGTLPAGLYWYRLQGAQASQTGTVAVHR
jgi:hypothetical protein